jgi:hypothetical protein
VLTLVLVMGGIIPEKGLTNLFRALENHPFLRISEVKRVTRIGPDL